MPKKVQETCQGAECERLAVGKTGLCNSHYAQWRQDGMPKDRVDWAKTKSRPLRVKYSDEKCLICPEPAFSNGLCRIHSWRWRQRGYPEIGPDLLIDRRLRKTGPGTSETELSETPLGPGAKLRTYREQIGFDRRKVANELGLTYQRLTDIEADRKPLTLESILSICEVLGCDPHSIDPRLASTRRK